MEQLLCESKDMLSSDYFAQYIVDVSLLSTITCAIYLLIRMLTYLAFMLNQKVTLKDIHVEIAQEFAQLGVCVAVMISVAAGLKSYIAQHYWLNMGASILLCIWSYSMIQAAALIEKAHSLEMNHNSYILRRNKILHKFN